MNQYYQYPNYPLWDADAWKKRRCAVDPLMQWIGSNCSRPNSDFVPPALGDPTAHPNYRTKIRGIDLPEVVSKVEACGVRYFSLEQGHKLWIAVVPKNSSEPPAMLVVPVRQHYTDPWWAMKTVRAYFDLIQSAAKENLCLIFLAMENADSDRIYCNILLEAAVLYAVDCSRVWLDVRCPLEAGKKLDSIEGFAWMDEEGKPCSADDCLQTLGGLGIPVLNISGRWATKDSLARGLVMDYAMNDGVFDRERFLHSKTARKLMQAIALEYEYDSVTQDCMGSYFQSRGLQLEDNRTDNARWLLVKPMENLGRLPLVVVMQEVYEANPHMAVSTVASYYEYLEMASQGECILLYFAQESIEANDRLAKILEQAQKRYPIDAERIYLTGHSHNGFFAMHFATRHPRLIAAAAILGNPMGLPTPEARGDAVLSYSDAQIEAMSRMDLPVINMCGYGEDFGRVPQETARYTLWVEAWLRRLKASQCPERTEAEIRAMRGRGTKAERKLALSGDFSETIWLDGVEHYIVDIKNTAGNCHLRVVSSENMPHMVTPAMQTISWNFLRRFKRDRTTGEIIELC